MRTILPGASVDSGNSMTVVGIDEYTIIVVAFVGTCQTSTWLLSTMSGAPSRNELADICPLTERLPSHDMLSHATALDAAIMLEFGGVVLSIGMMTGTVYSRGGS
jgi:hypothetical protein